MLDAALQANVQITHTRDSSHGDFATNIALMLAKPAGRNPRELAQAIVAAADCSACHEPWFEPDDDGEALECIQGFHTRSVDASSGMWQLSRLVRADADLAALVPLCAYDHCVGLDLNR